MKYKMSFYLYNTSPKRREICEEIFRELGYKVTGGETNLMTGEGVVSLETDEFHCLCCGKVIGIKQFREARHCEDCHYGKCKNERVDESHRQFDIPPFWIKMSD